MKSLKVKNILKEGAESKMDEQRKQEIETIQEALDEKRIREIQNLELRLEKDRLCAEMANVDAINNILNSTSENEIGCPMGDVKKKIEHKHTCQSVTCHPVEEVVVQEVQHGEGCHCEKCCPNPKKNWFQKNKRGLSIGAIWVIMIVLALGLSPQGAWATFLQESWVNLFVDFFKVGLFVIAGLLTFKIVKDKDEDE